jgi:hypothetical protein
MSKIELRGDRHDVFVIVDGVAIARLGRPNTPEPALGCRCKPDGS